MPADSLPRRIAKRTLAPVLNENTYEVFQALAMAYDIWSGALREPELELIDCAVREGETALDIGANYGLYSYHLSKGVGSHGHVYAFEPIPYTCRVFRKISRLLRFRNVRLIQMACGEENGRLKFNVPIQDSGAIIAGTVHLGNRNNARPGKERHARFSKDHRGFVRGRPDRRFSARPERSQLPQIRHRRRRPVCAARRCGAASQASAFSSLRDQSVVYGRLRSVG